MKKSIALFLCLLMVAALLPNVLPHAAYADDRYLEIDETNFPDANFRSWIIDNLDVSGNASTGYYMTRQQVAHVWEIRCSDQPISSLIGTSHFTELEVIEAHACGITDIDVTQNEYLYYLDLDNNSVGSIDVSHNPALVLLFIDSNGLTELDVTHNPKLQQLTFNYDSVSSIDLKNNTELQMLSCVETELTALDVSKCTALTFLSCFNNRLTSLDVSKNTALEKLYCYENQLTALNVTKNTALTVLRCGDNQIKSLDLSKNTALQDLRCYDNQLTALDVSKNTALWGLGCENNRLTTLDVSKNTALTYLSCYGNQLTALDVSKNTVLETLGCNDNQLTNLDVSKNTALTTLECSNNKLTALDASKNTELVELWCYENKLTSLDVSNITTLTVLDCSNNQLTALDVSKNTNLGELFCYNNQLKTLDLSKNTVLTSLACWVNQLTMLDLTNNTLLDDCWCSYQYAKNQVLQENNGVYTFDMTALVPIAYMTNVTMEDASNVLDPATGVVTFPDKVNSFEYKYATGQSDMYVIVEFGNEIEAAIEWDARDVKFKGATPYVIANGSAQTPRFVIKNAADGSVVDPANYDYEYVENTAPGTGYVIVTFKNEYSGTCRGFFKIYLPATTTTTVENVTSGIRLAWTEVPGADGYVIYRRAWSSTTNGWTDFVRWNNTTDLSWIDTTVYAGTRYQYGVKAYFNQRWDPIAEVYIGGNVGDNFNLGEVGPLKTTVRITTRTLNSVTAGKKQMTVKWSTSGLFTGYQVKYMDESGHYKLVTISNRKTSQTVIKGLTSGKTYIVHVRSYHVFNGTTYYGCWSNMKRCKVK